ncbi:hypothetical protein IFM89_017097 [Coptis chinensis]|uniref:Methyltransferase n=1 Tax=Coptis chinensis TaxID=261450 RepID=A0A835HI73_9MAGN|nr:hypothetical protein IFM89_017097 [Coptis chinensis]
MGTKRLLYPGKVFDLVHCARCRVPWHIEGGKLLLELNRVLRPSGYFGGLKHSKDTEASFYMFDLVSYTRVKNKGDPVSLFDRNVPLESCMHKILVDASERGSQWPEQWCARAEKVPYWLKSSQVGVYGKASPEDFTADYEHWKHVVSKSYLNRMGISWSKVRNVMDMRYVYGGWRWSTVRLNVQKFHFGGTPRKVLYHNESMLCPSQAAFNALRLSDEWIFMSSSN